MYKMHLYRALMSWQAAWCYVTFHYECPFEEDLTRMDNMDWDRMLGEWFLYGMYSYRNKKGVIPPRCSFENYYRYENGTYLRCFKERVTKQRNVDADTRYEKDIESHYLMYKTADDGSFLQCMQHMSNAAHYDEKEDGEGVCYPYRILDTDYENFAVHYLCDDWEEKYYDVPDQWLKSTSRARFDTWIRYDVWITTREEFPAADVVEKAKDIFRKNDFDPNNMLVIDHNSCDSIQFGNMTHPGENVVYITGPSIFNSGNKKH